MGRWWRGLARAAGVAVLAVAARAGDKVFSDFTIVERDVSETRFEEPALYCFTDGNCVSLFEEIATDGHRTIVRALSSDFGRTWGTISRLKDVSESVFPRVSCVERGDEHVCGATWVVNPETSSSKIYEARSLDGGDTWRVKKISTAAEAPFGNPDIACVAPDTDANGPLIGNVFSCLIVFDADKDMYGMDDAIILAQADSYDDNVETTQVLASPSLTGTKGIDPAIDCNRAGKICYVSYDGVDDDARRILVDNDAYQDPDDAAGRTDDPDQTIHIIKGITDKDPYFQWSSVYKLGHSEKVIEESSSGLVRLVARPSLRILSDDDAVVVFQARVHDGREEWIEASRTSNGGASWAQPQTVFDIASTSKGAEGASLWCYSDTSCVAVFEVDKSSTNGPMSIHTTDKGNTWSEAREFLNLPERLGSSSFDIYEDVVVTCIEDSADCIANFEGRSIFPQLEEEPETIMFTFANFGDGPPAVQPTPMPTKGPTRSPTKKDVTNAPNTPAPTTRAPTTPAPTTRAPTTRAPTTPAPNTPAPTTAPPTDAPTTDAPNTPAPTTAPPTDAPTTLAPNTPAPTTAPPTSDPTAGPTTSPSGSPTSPTIPGPTASPFVGDGQETSDPRSADSPVNTGIIIVAVSAALAIGGLTVIYLRQQSQAAAEFGSVVSHRVKDSPF